MRDFAKAVAGKVRRFLVLAGLALAGAVIFLGVQRAAGDAALQGKTAPDFHLKTLEDKTISISELKGKVVVIDFWATWCPPCRLSLPHIQKLSQDKEKHDQGLRVFAVNARETTDKISHFMTRNEYTFAVLLDSDGRAAHDYEVSGIPTSVVIGRDGKISAVFTGFDPHEGGKALDEAVEAALKSK